MKKILAALIGATMVMGAGMAAAAEVKGVIKNMNLETRMVTVDGTPVTVVNFPQAVSLAGYIVGTNVIITYATAGTANTASAIAKVAK